MQELYGEIAKQILLVVGVAGVVVLAAAAPGIVLAAKLFQQNRRRSFKKNEAQKVEQVVRRLQKNRLIVVKERRGKFVVELTKEGKRKFKEIQFENLQITKPPQWDRKWRVLVFDIPDKSHKRARDVLRGKIKEWNFYPMQKSVWVCPWPCEDEVQLAAELYEVAPYVRVAVAEKISEDREMREYFGLL